MKVLEVDSLQEGIEYAIKDIERVNVQLLDIENAVKHFSSLDDELTGQGGDAIRAFYRDCHLPFLEFFQESLEEFSEILMQMSQAVNSFESNKSGHVKEDYLENDVIDGLDTVETTTTELTAEANSIIESVQDLVAINKIDETEVIENVQRGRIKSNETVEELHALDESQVQALSPVLDRLRTMKQYVTELDSKFKRADLSVTSYDVNGVKDIGPLKAINPQLYANLDDLNARLFQDGSYQFGRALDAIDSAAMMGEARPELVTSPLDLEARILKGIGTGAVDVVVDTVTGVVDMVTNPIETLESIGYMIANPIDTGKYMANAVKDSFVRDVINGDAESRAHWFTYAAGTIAGTKGTSSAIKSTRMGSNALQNAKQGVQDIANKAGDIKVPNLSPFNPQHQLAPVGPVPYNVYDGYRVRDLYANAVKFSFGGKSNRDVGGTGNLEKSDRNFKEYRNASLNEIKKQLGIPRSQHPISQKMVPLTDRAGKRILNEMKQPIMTRELTYEINGKRVIIQDHSAGHKFEEGGIGDQPPHYNVRPPENTRTGKVEGMEDHYYFNKRNKK